MKDIFSSLDQEEKQKLKEDHFPSGWTRSWPL